MRKTVISIGLICAVIGVALAAGETAPAAGSPLEGTKWTVKVTPDESAAKAGEEPFEDTLVFDAGKVSMTVCMKYGFTASTYTAAKTEKSWSFKTNQTSEKEGKSAWTAEIMGDEIHGKMKWTKTNGTIVNYMFAGKKSS